MKSSNELKILIVEDDEPKLRSLVSFLLDNGISIVNIVTKASLASAIMALSTESFGLAVVDMSLPTYEEATDRHGGGNPLGFGGADILRFIRSEVPSTRSVVLTQYEEFPVGPDGEKRGLKELEDELRSELGTEFFGVIHYAGQHGEWRERLLSYLRKTLEAEH